MHLRILLRRLQYLDSLERINGGMRMRFVYLLICCCICFIFPLQSGAETLPNVKEGVDFHFFINPIAGPEEAYVELFLTNESKSNITFEAPTSQFYEIIVTDEKGQVVYQYSEGRAFLQAFQRIVLEPGESKTWLENLNEEKHLTPGKYSVKAELVAKPINHHQQNKIIDTAIMVVPEINSVIKDIKVESGEENSYVITGQSRSRSGELYYVVEDGHHEWIEETKLSIQPSFPDWNEFTFKVNLDKRRTLSELPFVLYIYEKDSQGNMINIYPKLLR
jgi:hypothetical protein